MFGYGEVNQYNSSSSLQTTFKNIKDEKFRSYVLKQKSNVFNALKTFFEISELTK